MHAEQETFLTALASDFNMEVPYLEYMVQAPEMLGFRVQGSCARLLVPGGPGGLGNYTYDLYKQ